MKILCKLIALRLHVHSMIAVLQCVEILQAVKRGVVTPEVLFAAIDNHAKLFRAAYGEDHVRPKHHWVLHLPKMLQMRGTLLTTLTQERKHRMVRRYTKERRNLKSFETGSVQDITCDAIHRFKHDKLIKGMLQPHTPTGSVASTLQNMFPAADKLVVSQSAVCADGRVHVADVVRVGGASNDFQIGKLLCNVSVDGTQFAIISIWRAAIVSPDAHDRLYRMHVHNNTEVIPASLVQCALPYNEDVWQHKSDVYIPWHHRAR